MRKIFKIFSFFALYLFILCSCINSLPNTSSVNSNSSNSDFNDENGINGINQSKIGEFLEYFNHDIDYKIGTVTDNYKIILCDDGTQFEFKYPGETEMFDTEEENAVMGRIHHMVGSLEMDTPYDVGEKIIVFYVTGSDGNHYVKTRSPIQISDLYTERYPSFEGNSRFNMPPEQYFKSFYEVIENNLLSKDNLKILTLEDAVKAVIAENNENFDDFIIKNNVCGEKYFHNEKDKVVYFPKTELSVALSESKGDVADVYNIDRYFFTVMTSTDYYYTVYLNGTMEKHNKNKASMSLHRPRQILPGIL